MCVCVCVCQTKLSRLCEQDKAVKMQEEKLQQLHREKVQLSVCVLMFVSLCRLICTISICVCLCVVWQHTLETALLSASQELSEQSGSSGAATQSLVQQRDVLQNGLLSTCRELSRVHTVSTHRHILAHTRITPDRWRKKNYILST